MSKIDKSSGSDQAFKLRLPLDASGIAGFDPSRKVKVAIQNAAGATQSQVVAFNKQGQGVAEFAFSEQPKKLSIVVGPPDAGDDEIFGLQTLRVDLPSRRFQEPVVTLHPIVIPSFYWHWWWRWCREFTIRGRVVCPDGRPVPGAKVSAFDVDAWWWWSSKQLVGSSTTDASGAFEIKFRWCCGWWPWYWWLSRVWHLEPYLIERIIPVLEREPRIPRIPLPDPAPDIRIFEHLLGSDRFGALNLKRHVTTETPVARTFKETINLKTSTTETISALKRSSVQINTNVLSDLREPLLKRLPHSPELEQLRIWPWWPWNPWLDCSPDIIFRVTQDCREAGTVIYEENYGQTHWNIPTTFDYTLVASDKACCVPEDPGTPEGTCALLTNICDNPINAIGGNPGAPATPEGYLNPGLISYYGDRPYGNNVLIQGQVGSAVDYYDFQYSDNGGITWKDMPTSAVGDIPRLNWIPLTNNFQYVPFLDTIDGKLVFESRHHYEATHDPGSWGITRFWLANNYFSLINWLTETPFLNGKYNLRIRGYQLSSGHLINEQILPTCSTENPAELVVQIDNRLEGALSGHPIGDINHPCGIGTVHTCTVEPDTDFLGVRIIHRDAITGVPTGISEVASCSSISIGPKDLLQVDFFANDPEGHLALYTLQATYGENLARPILDLPLRTLTPLSGAPVAAADQVGPGYSDALIAGASAPFWRGGAIRLEVPAGGVNGAFPETCCYQLELRAHKRTVVSCDHSLWGQTNYSEYSFMINV